LTANKAMRAILHVAKHLWQKAFHFLRRLGEIPQQGVTRRTIPIQPDVSMKIRFAIALAGLTISHGRLPDNYRTQLKQGEVPKCDQVCIDATLQIGKYLNR
jgi:hypothetical protein